MRKHVSAKVLMVAIIMFVVAIGCTCAEVLISNEMGNTADIIVEESLSTVELMGDISKGIESLQKGVELDRHAEGVKKSKIAENMGIEIEILDQNLNILNKQLEMQENEELEIAKTTFVRPHF